MTGKTSNSPLAQEVLGNWPALSFYYGLSVSELRQMPRFLRMEYARQLPELLASQQLRAIEAATFPWMAKESQATIMDDLQRHVQGSASMEAPAPRELPAGGGRSESTGIKGIPKPKTADEMAMLTMASGVGFVKEPGKHSEADYEGQLRRIDSERREAARLAHNAKGVSTDA